MVGHRSANMSWNSLKLSMQSRKRARCWWCGPLYQLLRCSSGGGFCPSGRKLGFQPVLLPFSPNGKAQHTKVFLIVLRRRRKRRRISSTYGEAGYANGRRRSGAGTLLSDEYKLALGEERGEFNVLLAMNGSQAHLSHSQWLQSAVNHVFLWSLYRSYRLAGRASTMGAIFARFGAKLENVSVGCCGRQGLTDMKRKTIKIRSGSMSILASGDAATAA